MRFFIRLLACLLFVLPASVALTQQQLVTDPEIYEKDHFRKVCAEAKFDPDYVTRLDINNDGLIDAIVNEGGLTCDGKHAPDCNEEGCPYNFYVQVKEGGYLLIATARIFGYDFIKRYGNMVFVLKMPPHYCDRTDGPQCEMTVRVRGVQFVTIFKK
ncbi:hypothetical protein [Allorhizobium terrae]|uniref:Uncharacterized protein n=1 Tax=Allorhizobium terrae TaxID=1848972 RepID=A0A4S3ZTM2_9HYPH|nr:hypothetical protein [Allorhizobium terrae]THF48905.1 hypothetical protein E6C51_13555 [Allorhizobium terrae]TWD55827.1 hypothetical protein FB480_102650 [Agrobacterium vitis]